ARMVFKDTLLPRMPTGTVGGMWFVNRTGRGAVVSMRRLGAKPARDYNELLVCRFAVRGRFRSVFLAARRVSFVRTGLLSHSRRTPSGHECWLGRAARLHLAPPPCAARRRGRGSGGAQDRFRGVLGVH